MQKKDMPRVRYLAAEKLPKVVTHTRTTVKTLKNGGCLNNTWIHLLYIILLYSSACISAAVCNLSSYTSAFLALVQHIYTYSVCILSFSCSISFSYYNYMTSIIQVLPTESENRWFSKEIFKVMCDLLNYNVSSESKNGDTSMSAFSIYMPRTHPCSLAEHEMCHFLGVRGIAFDQVNMLSLQEQT